MADNVTADAGSGGATFAADDIGGVHFPRTKLIIGADGTNDGDVSAANPLPVTAGSLPLPAGAATAAKQPALGTAGTASADVLTIQGVASMTAVQVADNGGSLTVDGTVTAANTAGEIAHDGADSGNPVKIGAVARSTAFPTAVSAAGDRVNVMADLFGRLMVANVPHGLLLTGQLARTDNTGADIIAAQGSGFVVVVTAVIVTNAHASVGTKVSIRDGTTVKLRQYAHHSGGGFVIGNGHAELFRSSDNAAITGICGTTGADVEITVIGYKAPA